MRMVRVLQSHLYSCYSLNNVVEKDPILATEAVKVINDNVNENEVVEILGHPLKIQAEREFNLFHHFPEKILTEFQVTSNTFLAYLRQEGLRAAIKDSSAWMIATSLISLFSAALLIWILIYIYRQKWVR